MRFICAILAALVMVCCANASGVRSVTVVRSNVRVNRVATVGVGHARFGYAAPVAFAAPVAYAAPVTFAAPVAYAAPVTFAVAPVATYATPVLAAPVAVAAPVAAYGAGCSCGTPALGVRLR